MEILLLILLFVGMCEPDGANEALFCEDCGELAAGGGADGQSGAGGRHGSGGAAGVGGDGGGCACDDGDPCNGLEECADDGSCLPGNPANISDDDLCTADRCIYDPTTGDVTITHEPHNIDDGDPCTMDVCISNEGVEHNPIPGCAN